MTREGARPFDNLRETRAERKKRRIAQRRKAAKADVETPQAPEVPIALEAEVQRDQAFFKLGHIAQDAAGIAADLRELVWKDAVTEEKLMLLAQRLDAVEAEADKSFDLYYVQRPKSFLAEALKAAG